MKLPTSDDELVANLIDLPPEARDAYLDRACGEDQQRRARLLDRVDQLVRELSAEINARRMPVSQAEIIRTLSAGLDAAEQRGSRVADYELVELLGEGGFGAVWLAEQLRPLRRHVAFKIIKLGMDTKEVVARFEAERQALALMEHPNIARVFEAGSTETGRPYFVMELVRGIPITRFCDERALTIEARLKLFALVCLAVQHAHQKGVIHRDLKPSNILVSSHDGKALPKVIDFGIAKATEARLTEIPLRTQLQAFVGTPVYTSPEQLDGNLQKIDSRSDIYSLGVLLYELLAGQPPFDLAALAPTGWAAVRRRLRETDPPRPSQLVAALAPAERLRIARARAIDAAKLCPWLRGDLDWIVMRCLEKEPERRYASAHDLAADIERHLNHEVVLARAPSTVYRLRKVIRRHRVLFATSAALLVSLIAGLTASSILLIRERAARERATTAEQTQNELRRQAETARAGETRAAAEAALDLAEHAFLERRADDGLAYLVHAGRKNPHHSVVAGRLLSALAARGFYLPDGSATAFPAAAQQAAFSPDGKEIFVVCTDDRVRVIDPVSGQLRREFRFDQRADVMAAMGRPLAFAANRPDLFALRLADNSVRLCDTQTGRAVAPPIVVGEVISRGPVLSPDGRWLVVGRGHLVWLFDVDTGHHVATLPHGKNGVLMSMTFSPDGRRLATTTLYERLARVWTIPDGTLAFPPLKSEHGQNQTAAFSPGGRMLAVGSTGAQLYDTATGRAVGPFLEHEDPVWSLAFTPDGNRVLTAGQEREIKVWDTATGALIHAPWRSRHGVHALQMIGDGAECFTKDSAGIGELWDLATGRVLAQTTIRAGRTATTEGFAGTTCSSDGKRVVLCGSDGKLYRLRLGGGPQRPLELVRQSTTDVMAFDAQRTGRLLWLTHSRARVIDIASGRELERQGFEFPEAATAIRVRRDQQALIAKTAHGWEAWFRSEGSLARTPLPTLVDAASFRFSAQGDLLDVVRYNDPTRAAPISLRTGHPVGPGVHLETELVASSHNFDPAGQMIALATETGDAGIWEVRTGRRIATLPVTNKARRSFVIFSPDGARVATGNVWGELGLWDAITGAPLCGAFGHRTLVSSLEFSPDGRRLLSAAPADGTARVWDAHTGQPVGRAMEHPRLRFAHFSGDGTRLVTAAPDGTARVWDALTGRPLTDPLRHRQEVTEAELDASGQFLLTRAGDIHAVWSLPPSLSTVPEWLLDLATICAGSRVTGEGVMAEAGNEQDDLRSVRQAVETLPPNDPAAAWVRWFLSEAASRGVAPNLDSSDLVGARSAP